jgi:glycosyltransferase involved in cell wall biosynthesis
MSAATENTTAQSLEIEVSDPAVMAVTPVVSVLMITYNHDPYLAEAIEGVIAQKTDFPVELVIGEDGSSDNTRAIALGYQHRYPGLLRVVYSEKNVGAFNNSNRCFHRLRGEFVAYCEGDDYWSDPLKLQKQVGFLRANPDYGMVHSDYDYLMRLFGVWRRVKNRNRLKHGVIPQGGEIYSDLLKRMFIRTCTMMCRATLLKQHYCSKLRSQDNPVGDRPIALHLSKLAKIGYIDEPLATYRRTPGSMINAGRLSVLRMRKKKINMFQAFATEFGASESEWLEMQKIHYRDVLFSSFLAKSRTDFAEAYTWLYRNDKNFAKSRRVVIMALLMKPPLLLNAVLYAGTAFREIKLWLISSRIVGKP